MRTCKACGQDKPETAEFWKPVKRGRGGLDGTCRACRSAQITAWKRANSVRLAQERREAYAADAGERHKLREARRAIRAPRLRKAQRLAQGVQGRNRELGLPFSPELVSTDYIIAWLVRQPDCPACKRPFDLTAHRSNNDAGPSMDRFKCTEGYTLENTELICWRCNNIKRNYEASDLEAVAQWMRTRGIAA